MTNLNMFAFDGNLTKDAEVKKIGDGNLFILSVAVNKSEKKDGQWSDYASYFDVTYYSKSDKIGEYLKKGKHVTVSGTIKQERWEKDGQKRSSVKFMADYLQPEFTKNSGDTKPASNANDFPEDIPF